MARSFLFGLIAGAIISVLTVLVEHSRIAFNSYALYGNGALIVPAILAPFALYPGWLSTLSRGGRALEMAVLVLGLHIGVGLTSVLEVLFYPSEPDLTLTDALPGFLLTGAVFVLPAALLAGLSYWAGMRLHGNALVAGIVIGVLIASFFAVWGIGLGVLAGGAVAIARRAPFQRVAVGVALFVAMVIAANLPLVAALTTPANSP